MRSLAVVLAAVISGPVAAATAGYFNLRPGVALESGDSWTDAGARYHLYGVQSCLRGTSYADSSGRREDCGEASLAVMAAFIADTKPVCSPIA
ncbi:MAG: thermonuclease family protein, partial [Mesorhizobium sp.]